MSDEVENILQFFKCDHLPEELMLLSKPFLLVATSLAERKMNHPQEQYNALRKLLEAKDCAVRAALPALRK